jgi:hypothetical protein
MQIRPELLLKFTSHDITKATGRLIYTGTHGRNNRNFKLLESIIRRAVDLYHEVYEN